MGMSPIYIMYGQHFHYEVSHITNTLIPMPAIMKDIRGQLANLNKYLQTEMN